MKGPFFIEQHFYASKPSLGIMLKLLEGKNATELTELNVKNMLMTTFGRIQVSVGTGSIVGEFVI
jgi:hypothetical protein